MSKITKKLTLLRKIEKSMQRHAAKLAALPSRYGFSTPKEFFNEVRAAFKFAKQAPTAGQKPHRKLTPKRKAKLVNELKAGHLKNDKLAKKYGISIATLFIIKRAAGLTRRRKKARR